MDAEQQQQQDWQEPPLPEKVPAAVKEEPQMSEIGTILNVFIEPGNTFEDLRRKPRFIIGLLIFVVLVTAFSLSLTAKIGDDGLRRFIAEQIDKSPQADSMSAEQKAQAVEMQVKISGYSRYIAPVFLVIFVVIGSLFYWLGAKAFGGDGGFLHGVSVFIYSSIPPTIVAMLANFILLALKSADDIDFAASQRGLVHLNPGAFMDGKAMPVLTTIVSFIDVFAIWGYVLAAIGLSKTNKLSTGASWAIVLILAAVGMLFRIVGAIFSGNPS